ncbi:nitrate- and nitrite sensing domain-containing protein [Nocardiopsis sp. RSe5-2]|uniref:histidine kinase n=1 Tax=Nocardiopsis endophytica TaxID=3018445 RepID=A0ABT4UCG4_9ACTN|nr:nitrate- and nitrite sensing domain-containing protein [Nocardiopsis endophytica]MDA2814651.1 nitrate- and nitrite sensing domain-containing protein [Nocardiopsis endophytica]
MGQSGGAERGIKAQLNRIVLIPSVTFLALFAVLSGVTLTQAVSLRLSSRDAREAVHLQQVLTELQRERRLAAELLADPDQSSLEAFRDQTAATDGAVERMAEAGDRLRGSRDTAVADRSSSFHASLARRGELRDQITAGDIGAPIAAADYGTAVERGVRVFDAVGRTAADGPSAAAAADTVALMRAQERFSRADALLSGGGDAGRAASLVEDAEARLSETGSSLAGDPARAHAALDASAEWSRARTLAERAAGQDGGGDAPPEGWRSAADAVDAGLTGLAAAQAGTVVDRTRDASNAMFSLALGGGTMALFAGTLAYGVASRSAGRLIGRLARLRAETLDLARTRLPRIVARLEQGEAVDLDREVRRLDHGDDEVGQVADAFTTAQRTAVRAAVRQADMRAGVNRVFLGIAHRNQSLVQRQLQLLDRIEREEEDPDLLEDLFHLDHLATRGRRNAENLIILGGGRPGRRWRTPIPLVDILRGAISETEEYARVELRVVPDVALSGTVVADVIHLVAELVENATAFSPPHTPVHIHSELVPKGVAVEIEDRGLGMGEEALSRANATLREAPEFDVMALNQDLRLGLFVVARLAAKHDVHVQLCPSPYGGTRAVVLIPAALIADRQAPARPARRGAQERRSARRTAPDLLAGAPAAARRPAPEPDPAHAGRQAAPSAAPARPGAPAQSAAHARTAPRDRSAAPRGARPAAPAPAPHEPTAPAPPAAEDGRPALPKRRRQAGLAPQLREDPAAPPAGAAAPALLEPSPERARAVMSAFQKGTRLGREDEHTGESSE